MKYTANEKDSTPAYLQLYRRMRDDIVKAVYPYGTRLPSKRTLAEELSLSTVTVEHAYALLREEGYLEARERSGYYVSFRSDDGFASFAEQKPKGEAPPPPSEIAPDFPFSVLTKTMRGVLTAYGEKILERSPNAGVFRLREAIARYLARSRGIYAAPEQIFIGAGSEYLYTMIVELLGRSRIYAIESPSYKKIEQVYRASDVTYESLPLGADGIKSDALRSSHADVLHITPYRSFPSGITASASKRHEYLRFACVHDRYIIEDDFESEFSMSKKAVDTLFGSSSAQNVIYMNSFSKTLSPALRVGYMVLPPRLLPVFEEKLGFFSCTVPTYVQLVLAELIDGGDFERHINRVRRKKRKEISSQ